MSYDIVKGLKIDTKENKVHIKAACNNVYPKNFTWAESYSLSLMLKEEGKKEVEKAILREYWAGNFQKSNNIYDKTIMFYRSRLPYNWDNVGMESDVGKEKYGCTIEYTEDELKESLYDCLMKFRKRDMTKRWVIRRRSGEFVRGKTKLNIKLVNSVDMAKKFKSYEEASIYCCGDVVEC